jgi:hypothetical protein
VRRLDVCPRGVTTRGISGEGATPSVVLDEQTRLLVENLVHSTIAARATDTVAHADAARDGTEPIAGRDAIENPPRSSGGGAGRASAEIDPGDEGDGGSSEGSDRGAESGIESEGDGVRATADPTFSSGWYVLCETRTRVPNLTSITLCI